MLVFCAKEFDVLVTGRQRFINTVVVQSTQVISGSCFWHRATSRHCRLASNHTQHMIARLQLPRLRKGASSVVNIVSAVLQSHMLSNDKCSLSFKSIMSATFTYIVKVKKYTTSWTCEKQHPYAFAWSHLLASNIADMVARSVRIHYRPFDKQTEDTTHINQPDFPHRLHTKPYGRIVVDLVTWCYFIPIRQSWRASICMSTTT